MLVKKQNSKFNKLKMSRALLWTCLPLLGLLVIKGSSAKVKWLTVPERNMEDGFEPSGNTTALKKKDHDDSEEEPEPAQPKGKFFQNLFNFGGKPQPVENDTAVNRVVGGSLSNQEGIARLIRDGTDIGKYYGFGEKGTTVILVDNRCKKDCEITLRCVSPTKDTGYFKINYEDGYILKFLTPDPATLNPKPWVCQFRNMQTKKRIIKDLYGRSAPKELVNFYEIRDKGIVRLDDSTARIDARQPISEW